MMTDLKDFSGSSGFVESVEIGGRPDVWFVCDVCGVSDVCDVSEYQDDGGPSVRIFKYNGQDACEDCLKSYCVVMGSWLVWFLWWKVFKLLVFDIGLVIKYCVWSHTTNIFYF